tara:strand:+ start:610 stop:1167 length:558 start_codon:yes stop_codon:yes gene_type:complete
MKTQFEILIICLSAKHKIHLYICNPKIKRKINMKNKILLLIVALSFSSLAYAGDKEDVIKQIMDNNKNLNKTRTASVDYSSQGALEFWSSGGLLQKIKPSGRPESYQSVNMTVKHVEVIILVPEKAAVAMYYQEGSMKPKGAPAVSHYMTRVTQAFVKEGGVWKVSASHWSPITGGSGTSQTSIN